MVDWNLNPLPVGDIWDLYREHDTSFPAAHRCNRPRERSDLATRWASKRYLICFIWTKPWSPENNSLWKATSPNFPHFALLRIFFNSRCLIMNLYFKESDHLWLKCLKAQVRELTHKGVDKSPEHKLFGNENNLEISLFVSKLWSIRWCHIWKESAPKGIPLKG